MVRCLFKFERHALKSYTDSVMMKGENTMYPILLIVNDEKIQGTLNDSEAAQALVKQLPLDVEMIELNENEKYVDLNQPLPTFKKNVESIETGDLMLYGDNTLVLFYEDFATSYSYTPLGSLDNPENLRVALGRGNIDVRIEEA